MSCFILWKNRSLAGASLPASDLVEPSGHSECQSLRDLRVFKYKFDGPFQGWSGPGAHGLQNLFFFFFSVKVFWVKKSPDDTFIPSCSSWFATGVPSGKCQMFFAGKAGGGWLITIWAKVSLRVFYEVDLCLFWKLGWKSPKDDTVPTDSWLMNKTAQLCSPGCSLWKPKK